MAITIRDTSPDDSEWVARAIASEWGSPLLVSRGRLHQAEHLPGLVAERDARPAGLLTYRICGDELEVVSIQAFEKRCGVGKALLVAARGRAARAGCRRLWLVTTNDNLAAIAFYMAMGMSRSAVYVGSMAEARKLKPEIPAVGASGLPIEDEHEFEVLW